MCAPTQQGRSAQQTRQLGEARRQQWVMRRYDSGHLDITGNEGSVGMVSPATKAKATVAEGHEGKLATVLR